MTTDRIVFTNEDGSVGVVIPTGEVPTSEVLVRTKNSPGVTNIRQVTVEELPQNRKFRNAWDDTNPENFVGINLTKAKDILHDIRRTDRDKKMAPLDAEQSYVTTTTLRKDEIALEKQAILDANALVQDAIDAAITVTELELISI